MGIEKRKDRRFYYHVKVVLVLGRTEVVAQTQDVSFKGIFVRTDTPLPERHLLRLRFTLPPKGDTLTLTGMVARSVPGGHGTPPGVGVQFYGASGADLDRWNEFIRFVAANAPGAKAVAPPPFPPGTPDAVRRRFPRYAAALKVNVHDVGALEQLYTRNVSKGGLFVATALDLPAGTALKLSVIHPKTGEPFPLDAEVRWRAAPPDAGLGLEFTHLDDARREAFFDFIRSEIPVEEVTYVSEGDTRLVAHGPRAPGDPAPDDAFDVDEG